METQTEKALVSRIRLVQLTLSKACKATIHFMRTKPLGATGVVIVLVATLVALTAPLAVPHDPWGVDSSTILQSPNTTFWFGTDMLGRDILSRTMYGARISMLVGLVSMAGASFMGTVVGITSAHFGGWYDLVVQRLIDGLTAFPSLLLAIALMAAFGQSLTNVMLALAIVFCPRITRVVRSAALGIKQTAYIDAARAIGATDLRIMMRHVLPNTFAPLIVITTASVGTMIIVEASLSFLGVGTPGGVISWGSLLSGEVQTFFATAPWIGLFPGFALTLVVFGINVFGDSLRDVLDPRLRGT